MKDTEDLLKDCAWEQILISLKLLSSFKRRSTGVLVGLCLFHSEKSPSLHLFPDSKSFFCHGCEAKGGMLSFIKRYTEDPPERIELLVRLLPPVVQVGQLSFPFYEVNASGAEP